MNKKSAAFTLVELMVVMIIIGSILALGIISISNLSKTTVLSETVGDVISILKETQTLAKNNSIPKSLTNTQKADNIYYYVLEFKHDPGSINRYLYSKNGSSWTKLTDYDETGIQSKLINAQANYGNGSGSECSYVMFEALTGDIKGVTSTLPVSPETLNASTLSQCDLSVILPKDDLSRTVVINFDKGTFGIKNETN